MAISLFRVKKIKMMAATVVSLAGWLDVMSYTYMPNLVEIRYPIVLRYRVVLIIMLTVLGCI